MAASEGDESSTNSSSLLSSDPDWPKMDSVVLHACSLAFIFVTSCLLNAAVVFLFYKRTYLQTPGNRFILALSISNLVAGMVVIPINWISLVLGKWTLGVMMCYATGFFMLCVLAGSVWTVALITLDR